MVEERLFFKVIKGLFTNKISILILLLLPLFTAMLFISPLKSSFVNKNESNSTISSFQQVNNNSSEAAVLGMDRYQPAPYIYISDKTGGYSAGGVITQTSTDEPSVQIGGYKLSGEVEVSIYKSDQQGLLDYITHDKDGQQLKKGTDISKFL